MLIAEPSGLVDVAIEHEDLRIDLRALAEGRLVSVEAVYHLRNDGDGKRIDLVFASGTQHVEKFEAWLDAQGLEVRPNTSVALPDSWAPPESTPGLAGQLPLPFMRHHRTPIVPVTFQAVIPPGTHRLRVRYEASAVRWDNGAPLVRHQFAYVLAPARAWSYFGTLDVTVLLPAEWLIASDPALARRGDKLHGRFDGLPSDSLAFTLSAPPGVVNRAQTSGGWALFWLMLLGGPIFCWYRGGTFLRSLGHAALWATAICATAFFTAYAPESALPTSQRTMHRGNFDIVIPLGILMLGALAVVLGTILGWYAARLRSSLRSRRATDPEAV